jgi:hypothetical protein
MLLIAVPNEILNIFLVSPYYLLSACYMTLDFTSLTLQQWDCEGNPMDSGRLTLFPLNSSSLGQEAQYCRRLLSASIDRLHDWKGDM